MKKRRRLGRPLTFFNWDGCCVVDSVNSVFLSLRDFSEFFHRRAPLETAFRQLSTCGLPVSNSCAIRRLLGEDFFYVKGGFWGGVGVPAYLSVLVPKLPRLHAASRCTVVDRCKPAVQTVEFMHTLVLIGRKTVAEMLVENAIQFLSLPSLLMFLIDSDWFKSPASLRDSNFQVNITSVAGNIKSYRLRATIEVEGGHAFSHVKHRDGNWYEVNNHIASRIRPSQAVGKNSIMLFYEHAEEATDRRKRLLGRAKTRRTRRRVLQTKDDES